MKTDISYIDISWRSQVGQPPPHIETRQLSLLLHGLAKRLLKANGDSSGPSKVLKLLTSWAKAHCIVDPTRDKACITGVSNALCDELGYSSKDLLGGDLGALMGPGTRPKIATALVRRTLHQRMCTTACSVVV